MVWVTVSALREEPHLLNNIHGIYYTLKFRALVFNASSFALEFLNINSVSVCYGSLMYRIFRLLLGWYCTNLQGGMSRRMDQKCDRYVR